MSSSAPFYIGVDTRRGPQTACSRRFSLPREYGELLQLLLNDPDVTQRPFLEYVLCCKNRASRQLHKRWACKDWFAESFRRLRDVKGHHPSLFASRGCSDRYGYR